MENIQYESFYKFMVSIGTVLIVCPLFCLHNLASGSYDIIITQKELETLSKESLTLLNTKLSYIKFILSYLPIICITFLIVGMIILGYGCYKWLNIQKTLDKLTSLDLTEKKLNIKKLSMEKIIEKASKESNYDSNICPSTNNLHTKPYTKYASHINKYIEIENLCFNYLETRLDSKYKLYRNIEYSNIPCDLLATSKYSNTDIIYEFKYWKNISTKNLNETILKLKSMAITYEKSSLRKCKCVLFIVINSDKISDSIKSKFKNISILQDINFINIEYFTEYEMKQLQKF